MTIVCSRNVFFSSMCKPFEWYDFLSFLFGVYFLLLIEHSRATLGRRGVEKIYTELKCI